jgi:hypothetical protein
MSAYPKTEGRCSVDGCGKPPFRRGLCTTHYTRWRKHGDLVTVLKPGPPRTMGQCSIASCNRDAIARSLCGKHYQRLQKYGDPLAAVLGPDRAPEERFWAKVNKAGPVHPELGPCWVWTAGLSGGYGIFWLNGKQNHAYAVSWKWANGPVPPKRELDHLCRNRACVRPDHLEVTTHWVNVARGESPHGINARKLACPQGHLYDEANTYIYDGERHCRECGRARTRKWWQERKRQ